MLCGLFFFFPFSPKEVIVSSGHTETLMLNEATDFPCKAAVLQTCRLTLGSLFMLNQANLEMHTEWNGMLPIHSQRKREAKNHLINFSTNKRIINYVRCNKEMIPRVQLWIDIKFYLN